MNRRELRAKLIRKGVSPEVIPYMSRLLIASNHTLLEFDGARSDAYKGNQGIIVPKINDSSIEFIGVNNEGKNNLFIRIEEPKSYYLGYNNDSNEIEARIAIQTKDGSIFETTAMPRRLTLFSPKIRYYSPKTVNEFAMKNYETMEDIFDIIFDKGPEPDQTIEQKCDRMSYRTPFEETKLMAFLKRSDKRKQIIK